MIYSRAFAAWLTRCNAWLAAQFMRSFQAHLNNAACPPEMALCRKLLLEVLCQRMDGYTSGPYTGPKCNVLPLALWILNGETPIIDGCHTAVEDQINATPASTACDHDFLACESCAELTLGMVWCWLASESLHWFHSAQSQAYIFLPAQRAGMPHSRLLQCQNLTVLQVSKQDLAQAGRKTKQQGLPLQLSRPHRWKRLEVYSEMARSYELSTWSPSSTSRTLADSVTRLP